MNADTDPNLMIPRAAYRELRAHRDRLWDALRIVIAANDAHLAIDEETEFDDLFERGLLTAVRDYADEYHAHTTPAGREFVREVVAESRKRADA